eukprot:20106-Heterococcus_DN1.PRE.1
MSIADNARINCQQLLAPDCPVIYLHICANNSAVQERGPNYGTTKSIVDTISIHALGQQSQPLEPCYERAAISGAIASLCSQLAADRMTNYWHAQRDHTSVVSLGTVLSIVSAGIAGVTIEAIRAKREQNLLDKVKTKQEGVAKMSDAELLLIMQKR